MAFAWEFLANLKGLKGDLGTWLQGVLPDESNLNSINGTNHVGLWYVPVTGVATMTNLPPYAGAANATLVVERGPASYGFTTQTYTVMGAIPAKWWRQMLTGSTWSAWKRLDNASTLLADGTDFDTLSGYDKTGTYYISSGTSAATMINKPAGSANGASLLVVRGGHAPGFGFTEQVFTVLSTPQRWWRTLISAGVWSEWDRIDGTAAFVLNSGHYGTPNAALIEDFKARHPVTSTNGKGAVVFRFDHGLTYLKSTILPMLNSGGRNWKCLIAMNSRNWAKTENSGMSQAEATALIDAGHEFANHSADGNPDGTTHKEMDSKAAIWDQIVVGKQELETQLGRPIERFIIPGTVNGMGGFTTGPSMDVYSSTYAGSVIMAFHAVFSGAFPNTRFRKLDGRLKQGQAYYNIESETVASIKAQIDIAVSTKTALEIMLHPRNIDQPGFLSLAGLTEVFAYIDTTVAANQLVVLGNSQALVATTEPVGTSLIR
ncbi:polysaccharide deacetylase family protein [Paenarthrobacter nitroguajacolicus]|nr:polysaccharide deacetylase family protein [Paenarthrobacter nitroguajacolicus]